MTFHTTNRSLANAQPHPVWQETKIPATAAPRLTGEVKCDIAIVGGGFVGLWTALMARQRRPEAAIVVLEAGRCGSEASGRNGGFCAPSISHGVSNALKRWPKEAEQLVRLGKENLVEFERDLRRFGMDVEFERSGKLTVASQPWQVEGLRSMKRNYERFGISCEYLDGERLKSLLDSPAYVAGMFEPNYALLNPVKMVSELRRVCLAQGVQLFEHSPVTALRQDGLHQVLETGLGAVKAAKVALATNIAPPLLGSLRSKVIPVFDYALATRPLDDAQLRAIGWSGRYGIADCGNQFHYLRKTEDNRILWGGYDAIYHFASRRDEALTQRPESFAALARQFQATFPALADITFSHAWGGIIDTSARTTFFCGTSSNGRVAYAQGFTGQGVSASRFAALTMLDLLEGKSTERTKLAMTSTAPFPFPPEPLRYVGVSLAQRSLAREDITGHRDWLLKGFDALGIGFDS
ncbi:MULTISPECIES: NAD(P)/FAD-dependent oxidoreductase [Pseudomonas]|jgi:Glycine/D-amino acid oxidases (deaminating)|uniref:FAD-dependent oxidoreductase n=2 Tax=Pseudomonas TaxID=286 RepID=A0ABY3PY29_9PSED|nr:MULTISPECIES: FAD-dependent oxidoreductase [Pseudomonas]QYY80492.1 FAD-dependent oxidoreductase [Pseudomonas germanica]UFP98700.1 FAD-dependent oxidoreductase [Pseudomonas fitomaticsae]